MAYPQRDGPKSSQGGLWGTGAGDPAGCQASFEPKIVAQGQARFRGFDNTIISMYVGRMSTREIQGHLEGEIEKLYLEASRYGFIQQDMQANRASESAAC